MYRSSDLFRLVQEHGQALTLRKVSTVGVYDPSSGGLTGEVTSDISILGYFYKEALGLDRGGQEVIRGERKVLISAKGLALTPENDDVILGLGDNVRVVSVITSYSSGQAICHQCTVQE
tara:strand:+ start:8968 stop:9324 length:357 start_codon:yes stop_codon:yes gene_type:complete